MILRSLRVEGFRCFAAPVEIPELSPGLNILHGPNASGKSTLLRALRHVMADSYHLSGAAAEAQMRPWGRDLSPQILAEFEHRGLQYRITKRFLNQSFSRLEQWEENRYVPWKDGRAADEALREMLLAEAPSKGLAGEAHMGILQILWTPQGPPTLENISQPVLSSIQQSLGAAAMSPRAHQIAESLRDEYLEYFTEKGAPKRSANSPLYPRQQELAELQEQVGRLRAQWQEADRQRGQARELDEAIAGLTGAITAGEAELGALERKTKEYQDLQLEAAERKRSEMEARLHWQELQEKVESWMRDIQKQRENLSELAGIADLLRTKKEEAETAARRVDDLNDQIYKLTAAQKFYKFTAEVNRIQAILEQLDHFRNIDEELQKQVAALRAPEANRVPELKRLIHELAMTRAQLEASSLKLTIAAEADTGIQVLQGAPEGEQRLAAGSELSIKGPEGVAIRVPGVGVIRAESANSTAASLAALLADLEGREKKMALEFDGAALDALVEKSERVAALQEQIRANRAEARAAAQGRKRQDWQEELDRIGVELEQLKPLCGDGVEPPRQAPESLQPDLQFAIDAKSATAAALASAVERQRQAEKLRIEFESRMAQHQAGPALETLKQSRDDAAVALQSASSLNRAATAKLQEMGMDPLAAKANLQASLSQQKAQREQKKQDLDFLQGQIHQTANSDLYAQLAAGEERAAQLSAEVDRRQRTAETLMRLHTELDSAKKEVSAAIPQTVAGAANKFWRRISGAPALVLSPKLELDTLDAGGFAAPHQDLSGGEKEQAAFALRLALAYQLAEAERQLAVFDDSFLATDPSRTRRILEILESAATERLQILVLTCDKERYDSLGSARILDLEVLKQPA